MVVSSFTTLVVLQTVTAWDPSVSYSGVAFSMTEKKYKFVDDKEKQWKNEDTINLQAAAARCLKHGEDCVGFFREDKNGSADTGFVPAIAAVIEDGPNADTCVKCSGYAYYNRSFTPANGRLKSDYTGLCMEAVPAGEGVMDIIGKACEPTSFQRWSLNNSALVYDGGVGRSFYAAPPKGADWKGAQLFLWDANLHPVGDDDIEWSYADEGTLKMNSKWHHSCLFTDSPVNGTLFLWDCNYSPAQQWTVGLMSDYWYAEHPARKEDKPKEEVPKLGSAYSETVTGKIELSDSPDTGTGVCLHAGKAEDGQQLSLEKCDDATTWTLDYNLESYGRGGSRVSSAKLSTEGKCITSPGNDRSNGAALWLWNCDYLASDETYYHGALSYYGQIREGTVAQVRSFTQSDEGVWSCADVIGDYVSGTQMQVWECSTLGTNTNQEFVWWDVDTKVQV
jgi:hypothetical protein